MGLLDSVIGALGQGGPGGQGGSQAALIQAMLAMLAGQGNGQAGGGGLADLLARLQQGGLGEAAASWVGTGPNAQVSASQLESALGADLLCSLARQFGIGQGELAGTLSQMLPQVVDRLTPDGQVPQGVPDFGPLGSLLDGLGGPR